MVTACICTLSLHDALPISLMDKFEEFGKCIDEEFARLKGIKNLEDFGRRVDEELARVKSFVKEEVAPETEKRSEEHTSELQSPYDLVCRLLLEKKNSRS